MVGPQTARSGVIAIDPPAARGGVAWDHGPAGANDEMSRFGMTSPCARVRTSTKAIKRNNAKPARIGCSPIDWPRSYMVRGLHHRNR